MRRQLSVFLALLLTLPFLSVQAQTTQDGGTEAMMGFGRAVSVADGTVFIGEPDNPHRSGLVYVYGHSGSEWAQQSTLSASEREVGDGFGSSLSAASGQLLVGAPGENGSVYYFELTGDSWNQAEQLTPSGDAAAAGFGTSVVLKDDHAFVGAPEQGGDAGAVYVFQRADDGTWTQQAQIANPDTAASKGFGSAIAVEGNTLAVSAPASGGGTVYVFEGSSDGEWMMKDELSNDRVDSRAQFGSTLALKSNQLLVGAPRQASGSGAVYVYDRNADSGTWSASGQLVAYDGGPRYRFGSAMTYVNDSVWIGAPRAENGRGALYQFEQQQNEWVSVSKVNGPERTGSDQFGGTVAVDGNVAVAGLTGVDYGAGSATILQKEDGGNMWSVSKTVIGESEAVLQPITGGAVECGNGKASHFDCQNIDLLSFLPTEDIGGPRGVRLNDIWGWTDPQTDKEYALVGRMDGTSFVDVSNPENPVYVANLPKPDSANTSVWRDVKVYKNHAYVVSDNAGEHGMQIVDLTDLRDFDGEPLQLDEAAHYDGIHSAHNVFINEDTGYAYVVGSSGGGNTCGGGLHMLNLEDPENPQFEGCFADPSTGRSGTGYSHDVQCVVYEGPDADYQGQEICIGANETAISFADVTDKKNPKAISTVSYPDYAYVHQGWLTEDHKYFVSNDELDELTGNVDSTRTLIWDVSDLDDPQYVTSHMWDNASSDHNLYIKDGIAYESNYVSGLQLLDVTDPENPKKVGSFDTAPFGEDAPGFAGTWSNYPYFDSGIVIMTSSQEGLFVLDPNQ